MRGGGQGSVRPHTGQRGVDPWFETETVVKEDVSVLQTNDVLWRRLVVVNGDVVHAHHFNAHQVTAYCGNKFGDVIGGHHYGVVLHFGVVPKAAGEAGEDHHQAGEERALRLSAHGRAFGINYLIEPNNYRTRNCYQSHLPPMYYE